MLENHYLPSHFEKIFSCSATVTTCLPNFISLQVHRDIYPLSTDPLLWVWGEGCGGGFSSKIMHLQLKLNYDFKAFNSVTLSGKIKCIM